MACCVYDIHRSPSRPIPISISPLLKIMPQLPPEIFPDILCRLPAKSLMRFRSVSKMWCSLIDSSDFLKMHLNHAQNSPHSRLLLGFLGVYSVDLGSLDVAHPLKTPFSATEISNSCNGLVLVSGPDNSPVYIWNPFTRKYKSLPDTPVDSLPETNEYTRYGFGYVSAADDYKVLRAVELRGPGYIWIGTEARVYSLKSNSWRKIEDFPYPIPRSRGWGVHVNGVLHTVIDQTIVGFDLVTEKCGVVPKPEGLLSDVNLMVCSLEGCLCLCSYTVRRKHKVDIWMMRQYGIKESWTKLLSVAPPSIQPQATVTPIAFSESGHEVLLNLNEEKLVWFDLKTKAIRQVDVQGTPFRFYAHFCIETLISPDACVEGFKPQKSFQQGKRYVKDRRKRNDFLSEGFKLVL